MLSTQGLYTYLIGWVGKLDVLKAGAPIKEKLYPATANAAGPGTFLIKAPALPSNNRQLVQDAINNNQNPRIEWRTIFGESLSRVAAHYYKIGLPWDIAFYELSEKAIDAGKDDYETLKKLKISIISMYSKLNTGATA